MPASSGGFGTGANRPPQCTAMSKRSGKQCLGPAVAGSANQRCRMHGGHGHSLMGTEDPNFRHGRYSKYLPSQLDKLYQEARSNPDLLEMADHIALLEARIQQVLLDNSQGEPVPNWGEVRTAFAALETSLLSGEIDKVVPGLEKVHALLDAGVRWDTTWNQVMGTMEQLRKLTDTDVKRKKELNQMVPIERVVILMAAVGEAVKRHVSNPAEIEAVYRDLATLHGTDTVPGNPQTERVPPVVQHKRLTETIDVESKSEP